MSDDNITENHETIAIADELKKSYLDYAMSVIVSRALPDVRDGQVQGRDLLHPPGPTQGAEAVRYRATGLGTDADDK